MPKRTKEMAATQVARLPLGLHAAGGATGLYLRVAPTGARNWILRAVVGNRRRDMGLGGWPDVSLAEARERARAARRKIEEGVDPIADRGAAAASLKLSQVMALTFDQAARMCHTTKIGEFRSRKHKDDWINSLDRYASPIIGELPIASLDLPHIVKVLEPIWTTKTETATRVRQRIESVLAWATVNKFRTGDNPAG